MKLRMIYKKFAVAVFAAGVLASVPGCIMDEGYDDDPASGGGFVMSVTMVTSSSASTRAGHTDDGEETGAVAENYVDFTANDFRIVLFDKDGNYIQEMDGDDEWDVFTSLDADYVYYKMERKLEFPESFTREDITRIRNGGVQVMVVGNWRGMDAAASYDDIFVDGGGHQMLSAIWKDDLHYNFSYRPESGNTSWRPDHTLPVKRLIPMFGIAQSSPFAARTGSDKVYASVTVPLQRAMAKIEVVDNLRSQPDLSIADVTLTDFNTSGRFIPDVEANPGWSAVGSQVESSSLPAGVAGSSAGLKFFRVTEAGVNKWVAYVPEMELDEPLFEGATNLFDAAANASRTHLNVKIDNTTAGEEVGTYPLHFASYNSASQPAIPDESWNHILRNHIYRFSVNRVSLTLDLHLHVIPWEADDEEVWDFTDHVTVSKMLTWRSESYETINSDTGEVYLHLDRDKILEGEFTLISPFNGRWHASLTPIGDAKINAMTFVDAEGNVLEPSEGDPAACLQVSGVIDKNEAVIRIRPTNFGDDYESKFRLDFYVENLGSWVDVPMVEGRSYQSYTIVRKQNIIQ